jgi:hypothetical protein
MIRNIAELLGLVGAVVGFVLAARRHFGWAIGVCATLCFVILLGYAAGQRVPPSDADFLPVLLALAAIPVAGGVAAGAVLGFLFRLARQYATRRGS